MRTENQVDISVYTLALFHKKLGPSELEVCIFHLILIDITPSLILSVKTRESAE